MDESTEKALAAQEIDQHDIAVLAVMASIYDAADPLPDGLVDRLKFGLALDEMMAEVASLSRVPMDAAGVRGEAAAPARAETITFSADVLTAMVTVVRLPQHPVRIDGGIVPAASMAVRLRMEEEQQQATADHTGRFSFADVPEGFAQLTFHDDADPGTAASVVTPLFEL